MPLLFEAFVVDCTAPLKRERNEKKRSKNEKERRQKKGQKNRRDLEENQFNKLCR